ncbi:ParA family protein [Aminobacter sp. NyZ550]|uniref:ParA family protein n=1 Tax=Aminobacter sp. NyZ550 TaxID=2979870 RepID=UPI0021D5EED4|nr:ParA family protein [Aminobacter sp. NyZ550]WAX97308.1 ParA family protein [Aminobacter sp. NyZ550]
MTTVAVVNMKGGVAKTTLATNLADALVKREDCKVLLVDLDPQFNATQCLLSGEEYVQRRQEGGHTIVTIFDDSPAPVSAVNLDAITPKLDLGQIKPWKVKDGFDLIPGDLELYRLEMAAGQGREQRLRRYLEAIKADEVYDFVIIDTPPTPSHWMMAALLASSGYLVPVKPEPLSRTGIDLLRGVVERCSNNHGHPIECLGVVLTIVETNTVVYREAIEFLDKNGVWKGKRFKNVLPKRTKLAAKQGSQKLILDLDDTTLKSHLAGIAREFLENAANG